MSHIMFQKEAGFVYSSTKQEELEWLETTRPFMDFFSGFSLRLTELRLGHMHFPVRKDGDTQIAFPVSKYGLNGAHHVLLEGSTFPPEKRSSMEQSLGPMTSFICMLRSDDKYRNKYENAVKRAASAESV